MTTDFPTLTPTSSVPSEPVSADDTNGLRFDPLTGNPLTALGQRAVGEPSQEQARVQTGNLPSGRLL